MRAAWLGIGLLAWASALGAPARAQRLDPVAARVERIRAEIYDVGQWLRRVPYELALPIVARSRVRGFIRDLPLEDDVRGRVLARVDSREFVDELIPFAIALKQMYTVPADDEARSFDAHLRRTYRPQESIPGMEHSMFRWELEPAGEEGGIGAALDPELVSELVRLYDALYLQRPEPAPALEGRLACARGSDPAGRRGAVSRAKPIVRRLLQQLAARLELDPEIALAVQALLEDDVRLESVTISLVQFTDELVCKHYRVFATRVFREEQLRGWMLAELERGGGALFDWLAHTQERRHVALVVVDGLQGHLVEALAGGPETGPFLARIREEQRAGARGLRVPRSQPAAEQQTRFLETIAIQGWNDRRYLPFFRDLYTRDRPGDPLDPTYVARVGISTTPTISVRNLPIAWTGAPVAGPGSTGVPNFHFVDRTHSRDGAIVGRPYYFYGNDALQLTRLTRESGMRSLFDRLPRRASMACGAMYDEAAHFTIDAFLNLGLGEKLRDFGELLCLAELERRAENEAELRALRAELLERRDELVRVFPWWHFFERQGQRDLRALARRRIARIAALEQETLPELLVYYNPWPDHFAHFTGPFADEIIAPSGELARLDYWLGRLRSAYEDGGAGARVLWGLAGDHGLAPVFALLNPEVEVFDALRAEGVDFRVEKISSDEGEGPKLNHPFDPPSMRAIDAVIASTAGGNYMIDLFRDHGEGWPQQPVLSELRAVSPHASGDASATSPVDIVEEIYRRLRKSLDYLVVREERCDVDGGRVRLIGARNGRRADAWVTRRGARIHYRWIGADLLSTDRPSPYRSPSKKGRETARRLRERCLEQAVEQDPESWCDEAAWRELTSYTERPDSVVQIAHLYDHPRAGTINLFPRAGVGYNSRVPGRHAGEHFHEKDALVGLYGAPLVRTGDRPRLRTAVIGSVPIALYEHLTGAAITPGSDGWGYTSLLEAQGSR